MKVKELQQAARTQTTEQFAASVGNWVLMQQPTGAVYQQLAMLLRRGETVRMAHEARLPQEILSMVQAFESLEVLSLGKLPEKKELIVGRAPECDLVIHEPSVSSRHAALRFFSERQQISLFDLGSRNGTFVNAKVLPDSGLVLFDGDALSFGDAQFLFMRADALQEQIKSAIQALPRSP